MATIGKTSIQPSERLAVPVRGVQDCLL